jgi:hypothetical protein
MQLRETIALYSQHINTGRILLPGIDIMYFVGKHCLHLQG